MVTSSSISPPALPFPIFRLSSAIERHMLYDINTITWLRRAHRILGVLVGTLPQIPQQNVFLGIPLELMPEEARLLSEKGLAYIVDDQEWHQEGFRSLTTEQQAAYSLKVEREGKEAAMAAERKKLESTERAMSQLSLNPTPKKGKTPKAEPSEKKDTLDDSESLFAPPSPENPTRGIHPRPLLSFNTIPAWKITPTTSYPPLPPPPNHPQHLPTVSSSAYALFKHLHAQNYFMSPGLRFGCQFLVYPGDPLRFHSHFLAVAAGWDEEIDLLHLVCGGRLGTGVKKGWLLGGPEEAAERERDGQGGMTERVRTFCVEWGGM